MSTLTRNSEYVLGQTLYVGWSMGYEVAPFKVGKVDRIVRGEGGEFLYYFNTPEGSRVEREQDLLSKDEVDDIG